MDLDSLLKKMVELKASDAFITLGAPLSCKINGEMQALGDVPLDKPQLESLVFALMTETQKAQFISQLELEFAIDKPGIGRFRISAFQQKLNYGAVIRRIEHEIPSLDALGVPTILKDLVLQKRGLILLVGATGAGKSTTLAAMIDHRNRMTRNHIITIEDPIEYVHTHQASIVTQREVGIDTSSYEAALKNTLRQAPDVILIGEIRNTETMKYALSFAETGHLCMATLHANNANQALERIAHLFPQESQRQLWMQLSLNLRGIVAQQLVTTLEGKGRLPVVEVMINTPAIAEHILKGEIDVLKEFIAKGSASGMQTFDQALYQRYAQGQISSDEALKHADSANDVRLLIKLNKPATEQLAVQAKSRLATFTIDERFKPEERR